MDKYIFDKNNGLWYKALARAGIDSADTVVVTGYSAGGCFHKVFPECG